MPSLGAKELSEAEKGLVLGSKRDTRVSMPYAYLDQSYITLNFIWISVFRISILSRACPMFHIALEHYTVVCTLSWSMSVPLSVHRNMNPNGLALRINLTTPKAHLGGVFCSTT